MLATDHGTASPARIFNVLVVAAHPLVRAGLSAMVARAPCLRLAGECSLADALRTTAGPAPDAILLDAGDRVNAAEATTRLCGRFPAVPILVLGDAPRYEEERELVLAGARGMLGRDEAGAHLDAAVLKVLEHELWMNRADVARLVDELAQQHAQQHAGEHRDARIGSLTERESEIVDLVAQGLCNKEIAGKLTISDNTVRHHLTSIFAKLGVHDRLALAVFAFRHGIAPVKS